MDKVGIVVHVGLRDTLSRSVAVGTYFDQFK